MNAIIFKIMQSLQSSKKLIMYKLKLFIFKFDFFNLYLSLLQYIERNKKSVIV